MPRTIGQFTGLTVTAVVALGSDADVLYAVPLGLLAGSLAGLLANFAELKRSRGETQASG